MHQTKAKFYDRILLQMLMTIAPIYTVEYNIRLIKYPTYVADIAMYNKKASVATTKIFDMCTR